MLKFSFIKHFLPFFIVIFFLNYQSLCSNTDIITHDAISINGGWSPVDQGTGGGANCHFPFVEDNKVWFGCDTNGDVPWCAVVPNLNDDNLWGYCSFPECRLMEVGAGYRGDIDYTNNGVKCSQWSSYTSAFTFFESSATEAGSRCRNPDLDNTPWCWTQGFGWGFCDHIPMCKDLRYSCKDPLVHNLAMASFSANSTKTVGTTVYSAHSATLSSSFAWCAEVNDQYQYLQIDMGKDVAVVGIATRGLAGSSSYVKTYRLEVSYDGVEWFPGQDSSLVGNSDSVTIVGERVLEFGRFVRIIPLTWNGDICMRVELGGCDYYDACRLSPCENNGTCTSDGLSSTYECACDPDYSGVNCHILTDYCDLDKPCKNGGTCVNTGLMGQNVKKYTCTCDSFGIYSGEFCENGESTSCGKLRELNFNISGVYDLDLYNTTRGCRMNLIARNISQMENITTVFTVGVSTEEDCGNKCLQDPDCKAVSWMFEPFICFIHHELVQIIDKDEGFSQKINYYLKECSTPVGVFCDFSHPNKTVSIIEPHFAKDFSEFRSIETKFAYRQVYHYYPVTKLQIDELKAHSYKCSQKFTFKCKGVTPTYWKMTFQDFETVLFTDPTFNPYCANCIFSESCYSPQTGGCSCRNLNFWSEDLGVFTDNEKIPIRMVHGGDTGSSFERVEFSVGPLLCEELNKGVVDLNQCDSNPCWNGTCIDQDMSYYCNCTAGYKGKICEFDINECLSSPCSSGASECLNLEGKYECVCKPGFIGEACEIDIDECVSSPCKNGGSCLNRDNYYECKCRKGSIGTNCHIAQDECQSNPCINAINCTDLHADYKCYCESGWTGKNCDEDFSECGSNPCVNGGTCQENTFDDYSCICDDGLHGKRCEININDCVVNNCKNGGSCKDGVNSWTCECASGYGGEICEREIEECASLPCKNGASCLESTVGSYTCLCSAGFTGAVCETEIDECLSEPCKNEAACINEIGFYTCKCVPPFVGKNCQFVVTDGQWGGWGAWADCSVDCGLGVQTRRRECNNPRPVHGGKKCAGSASEVIKCEKGACSTRDGKWGLWKEWSRCSVSCSTGQRKRIRKCDNPTPINGADCEGAGEIFEICKEVECGQPFDGGWSLWGSWSNCHKTCGPGVRYKRRYCDTPKPQWGGKDCEGSSSEYETCQMKPCQSTMTCKDFEKWSKCSESCGMGIHSRKRVCTMQTEDNLPESGVTVQPSVVTNEILQYEHKFCSDNKCPKLSCTVCVKKFTSDMDILQNRLSCRGPSLQCELGSPGCLYRFNKSPLESVVEKRCAKAGECTQRQTELCKNMYKFLIDIVNNDKPTVAQEDMEPHSDSILQLWQRFEEANCLICCTASFCNSPTLPPGNMLYSTASILANHLNLNYLLVYALSVFWFILKN
ncbi:DgyrCDS9128 [Dimorphilus gyrociliatus]|uniref:DgyrCDS9128 n=1 Tax=Dimorphilus gyrociliatus TaxID=2664684 RepID=A0A7I8VW56_9ANNE|nr:DgyrCDS9128 [Dimorphilus gyrociliatus]